MLIYIFAFAQFLNFGPGQVCLQFCIDFLIFVFHFLNAALKVFSQDSKTNNMAILEQSLCWEFLGKSVKHRKDGSLYESQTNYRTTDHPIPTCSISPLSSYRYSRVDILVYGKDQCPVNHQIILDSKEHTSGQPIIIDYLTKQNYIRTRERN